MKDRNDYLLAFNIILMYYNDILNYKLNGKFTNFENYIDDYEYIEPIETTKYVNAQKVEDTATSYSLN